MHANLIKYHEANRGLQTLPSCTAVKPAKVSGLISELIYSEAQLDMTQLLLVPLLQQLGAESRWQLWLTPQQKLSREWLRQYGLPLNKVMQVKSSDSIDTVETMIKALQTGNYSVVLGWLPSDISGDERRKLQKAAIYGQALGLIMQPDGVNFSKSGPHNGLKIQSGLYH